MKILITGATGFIGKKVCERTASQNHSILAFSRNADPLVNGKDNNGITWIKSGLSINEETLEQISSFEPEVVVNLAWEKIPDFSFGTCFDNLKDQLSFCKAMTEMPSVKKIIIAGSCWEYNKNMGECKESDSYSSKDYFTWAKNSIHDFLNIECSKKNIILAWARVFYVYGPSQRSGSLIPTLIKDISLNTVPDLRTPRNANDFIHVDDVAVAFEKMISQQIPSGNYNIGTGRSVPVLEICRIVENAISGTSALTDQLEVNSSKSEKNIDFWAGIGITKSALNWAPTISLEQGIKDTIVSIINTL